MNKVLFVEDNPMLLSIYEIAYKDIGIFAKSVKEAFESFEKYKPELVILDFNLGGETPIKFIDYIKALDTNVGIWIVSAYALTPALGVIDIAKEDYYQKPVDIAFLRSRIENYYKTRESK
jgi:DNA-binding response OmpR family regulator